ncbi:hypothetical protein CBR_g30841 [Chara braunii]|uniref:Uncharacterized protein n=1 Tax=Chara braunii TaxID=69332 RepID=A0A388JXS7_CHABU|nr:hypothetical protein CBR_g30841 [Chara braunii]|eukprot:GBG62523.1 hypothetical protein CBR_g30841 [Chara braunii]
MIFDGVLPLAALVELRHNQMQDGRDMIDEDDENSAKLSTWLYLTTAEQQHCQWRSVRGLNRTTAELTSVIDADGR